MRGTEKDHRQAVVERRNQAWSSALPRLRLRLRRRTGSPSERAAAPTQRALSRAGSRYYAAVFLPSFLSLPNDVFPAIGFPCEQWLGGWTGEEGKHEEKGVDSAHPLLIHRLFLRSTVYTRKMIGRGKKGRKTEERQKNLSRSEKGGNRAGSIGGNPSGRVSRFAEHEILPVSSLHRPARRVALSLSPTVPLTRAPGEHINALNDMHVHILASASSSSALIAPYPPPRAEGGDMRLDSSQLHRRFTIQFHLQSVPALRPATRRIDYRSTLFCASRRKISEGPRAWKYLASWRTHKMQVCKQK